MTEKITEEQAAEAYGLIPTYTLDPVDGTTKIVTVEWSNVFPILQKMASYGIVELGIRGVSRHKESYAVIGTVDDPSFGEDAAEMTRLHREILASKLWQLRALAQRAGKETTYTPVWRYVSLWNESDE